MSILQAIILGVLQGLTEFLPISSSGHLMLAEHLFGLKQNNLFFNVLLHFATLVAVVIVFWKDIVEILKHPLSSKMQAIVVATIPTVILALIVNHFTDEFALMAFLGFGFLISAIVIAATSIYQKKRPLVNCYQINNKKAFVIGLVQGLAVFPGISRSGSTICAGLLQGVQREECAKFSFLISIPVILGGMIFELYDAVRFGLNNIDALPCIIGFMVAFVVALFTIKFMMKIVKKGNWWYFAIYLSALGILVLLNQYVFCWF